MNRLLPLLLLPLLLLPLLLLGCNRATATGEVPVTVGFSCHAEGLYRGESVAGDLTRTAAGLLTLSLTKPDDLNGLTMEWDGKTVTLRMLGMEWSLDPEKVPKAALGKRVLQALDQAVYHQQSGTLTQDGRVKTEGEADTGVPYTLYSDPDTGALLSLEVPSEELSLVFTQFVKT